MVSKMWIKNLKKNNDLCELVHMNLPPVVKCSCKKIASYVFDYEPLCEDCIGNMRVVDNSNDDFLYFTMISLSFN